MIDKKAIPEPSYWKGKKQREESILGLALVAPLTLWLVFTILYPLISAVSISFQDIGMIGSGGSFIGFSNYGYILSQPKFWQSFGRSLLWVAGNSLIQTFAAFLTAVILMQRFRMRGSVRIWIILSWIVPTVVVIVIWRWLLGTSGGIVNYLLITLGIIPSPVGFFATGTTAFMSVVLINSWRWFPLMAVILLAAMEGIPRELYEAASVDGASAWQRFANITMPALQPVLFVLGLVGTLWSVNVFDIIWLATGGGPSGATTTLPVYIYEMAFKGYQLSRASAASVLMGIVLLIFVFLFNKFATPDSEKEKGALA